MIIAIPHPFFTNGCYDDSPFSHDISFRLTTSLSHSRPEANLRRSQGAANNPQPSQAEGTAAVGCRELVKQWVQHFQGNE